MIAYINGTVEDIAEENAVLDVNGIGYNIRISSDTASRLSLGKMMKLYTYTCVREDAFLLYGFLSRDDLDIFRKCITVSGIGPKGGLALLSVMDADSLRFAIISGDTKLISRAPGIGKRTAERLVLDLKDKLSVADTEIGREVINGGGDVADSRQKQEAVAALVSLGYGQAEAMKAVNGIENIEAMEAGAVLKAALKKMF